MTTICWDGRTLAADRMAERNGVRGTVTKIYRISGNLVGCAGNAARSVEMMAWFEEGANPKTLPKFQSDAEEYVDMLVITPARQILKYERSGHPIVFQDETMAIGSGRDFAMTAMFLGKNAREADEIACALDIGSGLGVDSLGFE